METNSEPKRHPAQLVRIDLWELHLRAFVIPDSSIGIDEFQITFGHSDFKQEEKELDVGVSLTAGKNDAAGGTPFYLRLELRGRFRIDDAGWSVEQIMRWAKGAAQLVMLPYLREHVYSATLRSGFKPVLLPLYQVPTNPGPVEAPEAEKVRLKGRES